MPCTLIAKIRLFVKTTPSRTVLKLPSICSPDTNIGEIVFMKVSLSTGLSLRNSAFLKSIISGSLSVCNGCFKYIIILTTRIVFVNIGQLYHLHQLVASVISLATSFLCSASKTHRALILLILASEPDSLRWIPVRVKNENIRNEATWQMGLNKPYYFKGGFAIVVWL